MYPTYTYICVCMYAYACVYVYAVYMCMHVTIINARRGHEFEKSKKYSGRFDGRKGTGE